MELLLDHGAVRAFPDRLTHDLRDQHLAVQDGAHTVLYEAVKFRLLTEAHLQLGRVDVHVDQRRVHIQHQHHQRITVDRKERMIRAQDSLMQPLIADVTPVDDRRHAAAVGTGQIGTADKSRNPVIQILRFDGHHPFGGVHAINGRDDLQ
ncbi:hypothetical protein D3C81_1500430 [compost metagenome]